MGRAAPEVRVVAVLGMLAAASCAKDRKSSAPPPIVETRSGEMPASSASRRQGIACGPRGLPPDRHYVAEGLCARVVAHGQGWLRGLTFAPNGDLLAVTSDGEIRRYRDVDHDGLFAAEAPETVVWAKTGGENGHSCQLDGDQLYCGSKGRIKRWRYAPGSDAGGPGEDVVVGLPEGGQHPRNPLLVANGFLYVASGSTANSIDPMPSDFDANRGVVKRFPLAKIAPGRALSWRDGEMVARGMRYATAIARDLRGRVVAIDNSIDEVHYRGLDVHEDNPGEPIFVLDGNRTYGWPFCFYAQRVFVDERVIPPGTPLAVDVKGNGRSDAWCGAHAARPMQLLQAHSSPLAMAFLDAARGALPARWNGGAFVALHGSWNRSRSTGHDVVWIPPIGDAPGPMPESTKDTTKFPYEIVFGGGRDGAHRDGAWSWKIGDASDDPVRPAGLAISPTDGALYVSSDDGRGAGAGGAIYRIAILGR